ncbi:MAG: isoprenylcysteine carboxylmethyltransferase family protein [Chitinophagales bacterium]|nr:isoprenylcysteine carboxylmethyltransferase family protein [Chitinophagales bacterium]
MNIIFIIIYILWFASEFALSRLLRSKNQDTENTDKYTLQLIWAGIITGNSIAGYISTAYYLPTSMNENIRYIGLLIIIIGCIIRFYAIYSLGVQFTVDVNIRNQHELNNKGIYKYFRHPSYTASLLSFIGFGISLNNWLSLIIITIIIIIVFQIRIKVEEKALIGKFGNDYINYKKETFGLIPFIL